MFQPRIKVRLALVGMLSLLLPLGFAWGSTFTVTIKPTNGGTVTWHTETPGGVTQGDGTLSGTGGSFSYIMSQTRIMLVFYPNPSGSIQAIVSDEGNEMPYLVYGDHLFWSGPSHSSKKVTVTFSGGAPVTPPSPTGNFPLTFPTNNATIAAVTDLTGNYTGVTPTSAQRAYDVTVAQDEAGKLMAMGTVQGIQMNSAIRSAVNTTNVLSYNIGAVTTVNNAPTVKTTGKFTGTVDGQPASSSGSGQAPVKLVDIGSGTNGISGKGSYVAKVAGVPLAPAKNQTLLLPAPAGAASHIHQAWGLSLTITNKINPKTAKPYIGAIGVLTRPDGDVIRYPEQVVKYSTKTGYALTLKGGSNITAQVADKKSTITIKGMIMTPTGQTWNPSAGTLSYQFLGQKGTGNLTNFLQHAN